MPVAGVMAQRRCGCLMLLRGHGERDMFKPLTVPSHVFGANRSCRWARQEIPKIHMSRPACCANRFDRLALCRKSCMSRTRLQACTRCHVRSRLGSPIERRSKLSHVDTGMHTVAPCSACQQVSIECRGVAAIGHRHAGQCASMSSVSAE